MTINEIKARVEKIEAMKGDDEIAHCEEDDLRGDFVAFIATLSDSGIRPSVSELAAMANLVLSTKDIEFARWCA